MTGDPFSFHQNALYSLSSAWFPCSSAHMLKSVSMYISGCLWWGRWVTRDTSEGQLDFSSLVTEGFALKIRINHLPRWKVLSRRSQHGNHCLAPTYQIPCWMPQATVFKKMKNFDPQPTSVALNLNGVFLAKPFIQDWNLVWWGWNAFLKLTETEIPGIRAEVQLLPRDRQKSAHTPATYVYSWVQMSRLANPLPFQFARFYNCSFLGEAAFWIFLICNLKKSIKCSKTKMCNYKFGLR